VPNPSECGIIATDEVGRVVEFVEKPMVPKSDNAFAGILVAQPILLDTLPEKLPADIGFDVLPALVGRMFAYPIPDYLRDIGNMEKYEHANRDWPGLM
jgi:NDP-sugar pyrophosphorylase family protein